MLDTLLSTLIQHLCCWPCDLVEILSLILCSAGMISLWRFYGVPGLVAYQTLAIIMANIQVLQVAQFSFGPMALGNSLFATTFWGTYLLTKRASAEVAHTTLMIGFWAQIGVTFFMVLSLGHDPKLITNDTQLIHQAHEHYQAITSLFTPSLRLVIASLIAFYISQRITILLSSNQRHTSFSSMVIMIVGNGIDQFIFSVLAWIALSPEPVTWVSLWKVYILPSFVFRITASLASPFVMHYSLPRNHAKDEKAEC